MERHIKIIIDIVINPDKRQATTTMDMKEDGKDFCGTEMDFMTIGRALIRHADSVLENSSRGFRDYIDNLKKKVDNGKV